MKNNVIIVSADRPVTSDYSFANCGWLPCQHKMVKNIHTPFLVIFHDKFFWKGKKNLCFVSVKLSDRERLDSEQLGNIEPFAVTNLPLYFINTEQSGFNEQFCNDQKVPHHQVWLYY